MATVDSLDIQIQASAQKANSAIDALNGKLNILATSLGKINGSTITGLANGVNRLSTAMQGMKSVGTADFTRLAKNIEKLGSMNAAGLNTAASSLSHISKALSGFESASAASAQLGDMAKNIAKLGNKSVQTAITNIPLLATAMRDLMQTLSTAPRVSQNLIDMTNALANFTQQGSKVSVVSGTLVNGLNRSSKAMNNAKKSSMSLAAAFGKFYATYFLLIRGIKKLWGSIQSSFDYLEVLNYFDAAFGQVAGNADLSAFEEMGYESADAYYGSFAKRAEEVTRKMSGFTIGENGLLQSTGTVSLGLDPSQLMNYQAMFGQMSSSMGVSSENALKLSQVMTEIGADLASVKNLDFEDVWRDMASGLAGMSRTLDKYGVNIRNVNLQQKLMELGIDANIQSLNQNDKALLRAIILLENTKYAWGDLADTINQPANQLRLIQANFENLGRTIGNLFLPIVKTVLPYVNALVIAVQRLFAWLGNLIGIDISDISTSIGGADMGDILDQTDDLASGLGDAKKQADKLNKSLRQFDELKVINTKQDDGGAGTGAGIQGGLLDAAFEDAFSKYQQEWDKAFGKLENKAQEIADKIEKALEPIKKIFKDLFDGEFELAGQDTSALVTGIFDFFADAIDRVDWKQIGHDIGEFLKGIEWTKVLKSVGNLIWQAINAAIETWEGAFNAAPIETAIITAIAALKFTGLGTKWFSTLSSKMSATVAGKSIGLVPTIVIAAATWKISFDVGKEIGKLLFPESAEWYDNFHWFGEGGFFDMSIEEAWGGLIEWAKDSNSQLGILIKLKERLEESGFKISGWVEFSTRIVGSLNKIKVWDGFSEWFKVSVSPWFTKDRWSALGENIKTGLESKSKEFFSWWKDKGAPDWFSVSVSPIFSYGRWSELGENIKSALSEKWESFTNWWNDGGAQKWFDISVSPIFSASNWNFSGITDGLSQAWENAVAAIKNIWNKFVEWINEKLDFSWSPISILGKEIVPGGNIKIGKLGKLPSYATGGFPEDGLFYANHNELVGEFSNGKTAVINNEQIIQGLADAIYPAVYNAVSAAMKNNGGSQEVKVTVESNNPELFRVIQDEANKFTTRTQKPAFPT